MTPLQIWNAFYHVCPIKSVSEWRPFGPDTIIVWFKGNRKIKTIKIFMIDETTFRIEPTTEKEWLNFMKRGVE